MHLYSQLLRRLRQNRLNPGGRGCSEQRLRCTPVWVTEQDSISKRKKKKRKEKKISWMEWSTPVFLATWEAEVGESLEPQRLRLQ